SAALVLFFLFVLVVLIVFEVLERDRGRPRERLLLAPRPRVARHHRAVLIHGVDVLALALTGVRADAGRGGGVEQCAGAGVQLAVFDVDLRGRLLLVVEVASRDLLVGRAHLALGHLALVVGRILGALAPAVRVAAEARGILGLVLVRALAVVGGQSKH